MMKPVRNSARLSSTVLGGVCCVPSAERSSDSTMMMRVKHVVTINMPGAMESTVSSASIWTRRPVTDAPPGPLVAPPPRSRFRDWAFAG